MPKSFSEEFKKNIVSSYKRGESISAICKDHSISKTTVYNWVRLYTPNKTKGKLVFTGREVHLLKQELSILKEENSILRQCNCSIYSSIPDKIREIKKLDKKYSYHSLCRALDIRRSVLYYHLNYRKDETVFEQDDNKMKPLIKELFEESHERFGSRMIRIKILEMGITISQERTARLMKEMGLVCNSSKKLLPEYKREYPYSRSSYCINKLGRKFQQEHPNLVWVSDITYLRTREGIYYLCVILDLFSRRVLSYKLSDIANTDLVIETFNQAYLFRKQPQGLMFHSDQGTQYVSSKFKSHLRSLNVIQSFSNAGTPHDNAVAESFFASLKREELYQHIYQGLEDITAAVDEYIHFFNNDRPHQCLSYKTPIQMEKDYYEN